MHIKYHYLNSNKVKYQEFPCKLYITIITLINKSIDFNMYVQNNEIILKLTYTYNTVNVQRRRIADCE